MALFLDSILNHNIFTNRALPKSGNPLLTSTYSKVRSYAGIAAILVIGLIGLTACGEEEENIPTVEALRSMETGDGSAQFDEFMEMVENYEAQKSTN